MAVSGVPDAVPSAVTVTVRSGSEPPVDPPPRRWRSRWWSSPGRRPAAGPSSMAATTPTATTPATTAAPSSAHPHRACICVPPGSSVVGRRSGPVGSRLAGWCRAPSPPATAAAHAGQAHQRPARGRRLVVRAQVGRLPVRGVPRRRRRRAREPQRAAAHPLLPGAPGPAAGAAPRALRGRRRDRDPVGETTTASTSTRCSSASTPPSLGCGAWRPRRRPSIVLFDVLAVGDRVLTEEPLAERRRLLQSLLPRPVAPALPHTGVRRPRSWPEGWFHRFEGAGLDGIVAKRLDGPYTPDKRTMVKVKHERTADCAVAGYRIHKDGERRRLVAPRPLRRRGHAAPRRRGGGFHREATTRAAGRAAAVDRERPRGPSVAAVGRGHGPTRRAACRARRAAGTPARTCRGCRSGWSGWPR